MTFANRVEAEIVGLHRFLEDWFTAAVPNSSETFARLAQAWSAPLLLISPTNEFLSASTVLQTTMAQYGAFPGLKIGIRNLQVTAECDSAVAIALYEEWHIEQGLSAGCTCTNLRCTGTEADTVRVLPRCTNAARRRKADHCNRRLLSRLRASQYASTHG